MKLTIIGCGDAFGSGGRLQTSFLLETGGDQVLIDCGATTLIGMQKLGLDPNRISTILISHLHGDHFGGLVWWLVHARHVARRSKPLTIAGPVGLEARFRTAAEALFPGATEPPPAFPLIFMEYAHGAAMDVGPLVVTPFEVTHPSGATPFALRMETSGKVVSFSGDTEWVENLIPAASGADLFITECYGFETEVRYHMTWRTIEKNLDRLAAKSYLLTHMGLEMLARQSEVRHPKVRLASDGLTLEL